MAVSTVLAKQCILMVEKTGGGGTFTPIGCADGVNFNSQVPIEVLNCRSGKEKEAGDDADIKVDLKGVKKIYTLTDIATNVSYDELFAWHLAKTKKKFKMVDADWNNGTPTPIVGSVTHEGFAMIESISKEAGETGRQRYNISLSFDTAGYTLSTVTA